MCRWYSVLGEDFRPRCDDRITFTAPNGSADRLRTISSYVIGSVSVTCCRPVIVCRLNLERLCLELGVMTACPLWLLTKEKTLLLLAAE